MQKTITNVHLRRWRHRMAKKAKSSPSTPTLVTFVLDRSSSMSSCWDSTIEAFNGYVDGLRDTPDIDFTLVQFDHHHASMQLEKTCVAIPVKQAPKLSRDNYQPRGSTPLIDAAYTVIKAVEASLESKPKDTKVVICIQTDGEENCSRQHTWEQLASLVKEKQDLGWQFNFMGAGIDAYQQGARMGVAAQSTMSYDHTDLGSTRAAFAASAQNTRMYSSGLSASTAYSDLQKQAAGDRYNNVQGQYPTPGGIAAPLGGVTGIPSPHQVHITGYTGASIPFDLSTVQDTPPVTGKDKFTL
jgi:Mg-chelatase subunit ChlD